MPFPNEHAVRLEDPKKFRQFARREIKPGVTAIFGFDEGSDDRSSIQALRFSKENFTVAEAKAWLKENNYSESINVLEPATGKVDSQKQTRKIKQIILK